MIILSAVASVAYQHIPSDRQVALGGRAAQPAADLGPNVKLMRGRLAADSIGRAMFPTSCGRMARTSCGVHDTIPPAMASLQTDERAAGEDPVNPVALLDRVGSGTDTPPCQLLTVGP
jgi:hypothetical protein